MSSFNASLEEDDEKIEASEAFFCSYLNINTITLNRINKKIEMICLEQISFI